ncbi:hypothetical protein Jiend_61270 [Micromonospora endophytica]|nr:hypothetical protein Jiend_61270 [Micromonospora endophytica]
MLGDPLTRPEAVEDGAARKTPLSQFGMDATAEITAQIAACLSGGLVDSEVR